MIACLLVNRKTSENLFDWDSRKEETSRKAFQHFGNKMKYFCLFSGLLIVLCTSVTNAQVLFEGYSKITLGGDFIGFVIQRYEFNTAQKNFISTSIVKYNELGGSITESLKATSNAALEPVSYTYNMMGPGGVKTIEAKNEKGKLKLSITEKGKTAKKEKVLPKGAFFSNFLAYVILKNPNGLKANAKYEYQAVAEEDGEIYKGTATVLSEETYKNLPVYKILNDFKDAQFVSYATSKGEMIATLAPQKALTLELVADPALAMGGLSVGADNLKLLFGNIPEGKINALVAGKPAVSATVTATPVATPAISLSKPDGVKGLELQAPPKTNEPGKQGTRKGLGIQTKSK